MNDENLGGVIEDLEELERLRNLKKDLEDMVKTNKEKYILKFYLRQLISRYNKPKDKLVH